MHEIDEMLKLQLEGKHKEARVLSDKLEAIGPEKILDPNGKNTQDIWMRHCFNRGWFLIQDGDYQKGCQYLENGRFLSVYGSPPLRTDAPIFNPDQHDIKGKSIIISLEGKVKKLKLVFVGRAIPSLSINSLDVSLKTSSLT